MYDFGVNLGTAFQIDDDILDLYGNELAVGKQVGGDIIEGKHSALMILSKKIANPSQLEQLNLFLSYSNVQKKVKDVKALFNSMNVKDAASELKNQYYSKAVKSIELLSIQDAQKKLLLDFAENLMNRKF